MRLRRRFIAALSLATFFTSGSALAITLSTEIETWGASGYLYVSARAEIDAPPPQEVQFDGDDISFATHLAAHAESIGDSIALGTASMSVASDVNVGAYVDTSTADVVLFGAIAGTGLAISDARCENYCSAPYATGFTDGLYTIEFRLTAPHYFSLSAITINALTGVPQDYYSPFNEASSFFTLWNIYTHESLADITEGGTSLMGILPVGHYRIAAGYFVSVDVQADENGIREFAASGETRYRIVLNPETPPSVVPLPSTFWFLSTALGVAGWLRTKLSGKLQ